MKLKLADEESRINYWDVANNWANQQEWSYYMDDKYPAIKGVAEYLANEDGLTLFQSYVGRDYE